MKAILQFIFAALTLAGQVLAFETSDWGINYLNAHPTGLKPLPLALGIVASFLFTMTISPISNATKPPIVAGKDKGIVNPFWGWFAVCLVITFVINLMLE